MRGQPGAPRGPGSRHAVPCRCRFLHPLPVPPGFGATQPGVICAPPTPCSFPGGARVGGTLFYALKPRYPQPRAAPVSGSGQRLQEPGLAAVRRGAARGAGPPPRTQLHLHRACSPHAWPSPEPTGLNSQRRGGAGGGGGARPSAPAGAAPRGLDAGLSWVLWGRGSSGAAPAPSGEGGPGPGVGGRMGQAAGPPRVQGLGGGCGSDRG